MFDPTVPLTPSALPQQRIVAVRDLPPRPEGLVYQHEDRPRPKALQQVSHPREATFLCQVEWAWSPMHSAIQAHYLGTHGDYWTVWFRWLDVTSWEWHWHFDGWAHRKAAVSERTAACHLLADQWREQRDGLGHDHYHWINEEGLFDTADIDAIGRMVWP
ncbi:MAG: hypothetical protein AAGH19_10435 [Pseudomonadota bacterium]